MIQKLIVTKDSYEIRRKVYEKYSERILEAQSDKEEARSQGDLSENFGYVEAKKTEENLRRIQADLQMDSPFDIVDPMDWTQIDMEDMPRAMVGAKIEILRNGEKETLIIGGAWDSDLENPQIVPYTSPLAKALIPKQPGFKTILGTSNETIEIVSSQPPKKEDIVNFYKKEKQKIKQKTNDQSPTHEVGI